MNLRKVIRDAVVPGARANRAAVERQALDIARYRYLLRVASPGVFDRVHTDAFAQLPASAREQLYRGLCHELTEEDRPVSVDPAELARAAAWAHDADPASVLRVLRRPVGHDAAAPQPAAGRRRSEPTLYAASLLSLVARLSVASPAAAETLLGFGTSVEAAQVDPSFSVPRPKGEDGGLPPVAWPQ